RGAGVPEGAEEEGAGAGRGCEGAAGCGGAAGGPAVAARPEGGGGGGVEGPQRGDGERGAGTGQGVVLVVVGRRAGGSAGADLDDLQLGEQEVGQQQPVDEGEHAGVVDEGVGGAGVVQHPVDAADVAGAEGVAAGGGEQRGEVVADAAAGGRGEQAGQDEVAVAVERRHACHDRSPAPRAAVEKRQISSRMPARSGRGSWSRTTARMERMPPTTAADISSGSRPRVTAPSACPAATCLAPIAITCRVQRASIAATRASPTMRPSTTGASGSS